MLASTDQINDFIREHYNQLDVWKVVAIQIHELAAAVYKDLDPDGVAPPLVAWAAILELRQLARAICRARQVNDEHRAESGSLFDFMLQPRYPAERDSDDAYVLRDHLTVAERRDNITRLRREAAAKTQHADALEAETEEMIRSGDLKETTA